MINNKICGGQHSSYVCGSASAYCGALKYTFLSSSSSDSSSEDDVSNKITIPDLNAETLLLFKNVNVIGGHESVFLCWDQGSTRCLVTHSRAATTCLRWSRMMG